MLETFARHLLVKYESKTSRRKPAVPKKLLPVNFSWFSASHPTAVVYPRSSLFLLVPAGARRRANTADTAEPLLSNRPSSAAPWP